MDGILCINKPPAFTSFDVVAKLRGITRTKRIGHSGTLDPMATGVLPVFIGKATKAIDLLPDSDKRYTAGFQLGITTDTLDDTGETLSTCDAHVTQPQILAVMEQFKGTITQLPPMYSAVKVDGKRLYQLARQGKEIERKPREAKIFSLELLSFDEDTQTGVLDIKCGKGTYIRTLCDDIGRTLGVGGMMTTLVRTESGGFTLDDCHGFDEIQQLKQNEQLEQSLWPIERLFGRYPRIILSEIQSRMFSNGVKLDLNRVQYDGKGGYHRIYDHEHQFLGLAQPEFEQQELLLVKLFAQR